MNGRTIVEIDLRARSLAQSIHDQDPETYDILEVLETMPLDELQIIYDRLEQKRKSKILAAGIVLLRDKFDRTR